MGGSHAGHLSLHHFPEEVPVIQRVGKKGLPSLSRNTRVVPRGNMVRLWAVVGLAATVSSCGLGRSVGRGVGTGAVDALVGRDTTLISLEQQLADSAGTFLGRAMARAVFEPARAVADTIGQLALARADSAAVRLAQRVETDLDESLQRLLTDNFDLLDRRGSGLAGATARQFLDVIGRELSEVLGQAGDSLAQRTVRGLALGLRSELEPVLHEVMQAVTDSLRNRIRQVDSTVARSQTVGGVKYTLLGGIAIVLLGLGVIGVGHWRRQRRALHAMIDAVNARGDPQLDEAVRSCAREAGVHTWLGDRIETRKGPGAPPPGRGV